MHARPTLSRDVLAFAPMSTLQVLAVGIAAGLTALDGFDVLSISFAAPGISAEWHIDRAALGVVLSMELLGMALGSILLGGVTDRIGRRPIALGCLVLMSIGMFRVARVEGVVDLEWWRFVTGFGIGGLLATSSAIAAEFSNARRRTLCVALMAVGYPMGAVLGGLIVQELLRDHDWRSVFYLGAAATAAFIPLVWQWVPESVAWLSQAQPHRALERINTTLLRMRQAPIAMLPPIEKTRGTQSLLGLFSPGLLRTTSLCTAAYFSQITTFYFLLKWIPKEVADMGFPASQAAGVLVWANVGGGLGGTIFGLLSQRVALKSLTITVMLASTCTVILFGHSEANLQVLSMLALLAAFFTNAGIVGLYAIFTMAFPIANRASGTGFAIGVGRGGSVLAPIAAGLLFESGYGLPSVSVFMSLGSLMAAVSLALLGPIAVNSNGGDEQ